MFWYLVVLLFVGKTIHVEGIGSIVTPGKAECDSSKPGTGKILSVTIEGCETDSVCTMLQDHNYSITIKFIPGQTASAFDVDLKAELGPVLTSFRMVNFNTKGCPDHGVVCPLVADQTYTYTNVIAIKPYFPAAKFKIQILITGDNDSLIACENINIKIVRPTSN